MRLCYGRFYDLGPKLRLDPKNVPRQFWPLVPYAEFWGICDDCERERLLEQAPPHVQANLNEVVATFDNAMDEWLAGPEADAPHSSDEYIAFSAMRMAAYSVTGKRELMHGLLLFDVTEHPISVVSLERIFESVPGFREVRRNTPIGTPIEADYVDGQDFTTVRLMTNSEAVSIDGTSGAALFAAWILQSHLDIPLRMIDTEYSFDLILSDFATVDELQRAMDRGHSAD